MCRGIVVRVLSNGAYSARVKTDDLDAAAVCEGVLGGGCAVGADSDRGGVIRYIVCSKGICTGVGACDREREGESSVLITLITGDGLAEIKVILSKAVDVAGALLVRIGGVLAVETYGCSRVAKNIALYMELVVSVSYDEADAEIAVALMSSAKAKSITMTVVNLLFIFASFSYE